MSKIKTIKLLNFKAIEEFEANFNGCTAVVIAGNDKGKTSFLRGIVDRIRFIRPGQKVHKGKESGNGELVLDTGEKFIWEFDDIGKDKLIYIDSEGIKQTVTVDLGKRFFPPTFEVDKFLNSTPKEQEKQLQKIVGLDFDDVNKRYLEAYNLRTSNNADAEKFHVKLSQMLKVDKVDFVDLTGLQKKKEAIRVRLNTLYTSNKEVNDVARNIWNQKKDEINEEVNVFNHSQSLIKQHIEVWRQYLSDLENVLDQNVKLMILVDLSGLKKFIEAMPGPQPNKIASELYPKEPEYIKEMPDDKEMRDIDSEILAASQTNADAQKYHDYISYKATTEAAKVEADEADDAVKKIEAEREKMIQSAKFPKGITIDSDGIKVDGFHMDKNQISTSKLYTTALRIASMNLGEVKTLYFDASYLDKNTLKEIQDWAHENDLQLLIERPDFEDGEIQYHIIEN